MDEHWLNVTVLAKTTRIALFMKAALLVRGGSTAVKLQNDPYFISIACSYPELPMVNDRTRRVLELEKNASKH